jgi:hypothetical protein
MATKNFTQFDLRTPLLTSDYIVGYKADGSAEYKATVKQIVDLVQNSDQQTLSFNEANKNLSISSGNTVSLSALVDSSIDTGVRALTAKYEDVSTVVQTNSASWATDSTTDTEVRALTGNWQSTYNTFTTTSAFNVQSRSTLETPTTGLSTINNIVSLSQATYDALTVKLPTTLYLIV